MDLKQFLDDVRALFGYDIKADTIEDAKRQLDEKNQWRWRRQESRKRQKRQARNHCFRASYH